MNRMVVEWALLAVFERIVFGNIKLMSQEYVSIISDNIVIIIMGLR